MFDVEFRIMAVKERREKYVLPMLDSLGENESIVSYDDKKRKKKIAMENAKRTWMKKTSKDFVCVLQDDLLLCDNFTDIVKECANAFPYSIFSFFQTRLGWEDKKAETPYVRIRGSGTYGQAIMIPSKLIPIVFEWGEKNFGNEYPHDDIMIGLFAEKNNIPVMATIPCLVQHLAHNDSVLGYNNKNKVSKVFCKSPDISEFKTKEFFVSKSIPNSSIPPKGGYKYGKLLSIKEMEGRGIMF